MWKKSTRTPASGADFDICDAIASKLAENKAQFEELSTLTKLMNTPQGNAQTVEDIHIAIQKVQKSLHDVVNQVAGYAMKKSSGPVRVSWLQQVLALLLFRSKAGKLSKKESSKLMSLLVQGMPLCHFLHLRPHDIPRASHDFFQI